MNTKLVTSRKWHRPEIEAFVSQEEVGARMDIADFITAVIEHVGSPALLVSKAALRIKLEAAAEAVLKELRETTRYVV